MTTSFYDVLGEVLRLLLSERIDLPQHPQSPWHVKAEIAASEATDQLAQFKVRSFEHWKIVAVPYTVGTRTSH